MVVLLHYRKNNCKCLKVSTALQDLIFFVLRQNLVFIKGKNHIFASKHIRGILFLDVFGGEQYYASRLLFALLYKSILKSIVDPGCVNLISFD